MPIQQIRTACNKLINKYSNIFFLKTLLFEQGLYFDDNLHFPEADMFPDHAQANWQILNGNLNGTITNKIYMLLVPNDPLNIDQYVYGYNSDGIEFYIRYYLEEGGPQDIHGY